MIGVCQWSFSHAFRRRIGSSALVSHMILGMFRIERSKEFFTNARIPLLQARVTGPPATERTFILRVHFINNCLHPPCSTNNVPLLMPVDPRPCFRIFNHIFRAQDDLRRKTYLTLNKTLPLFSSLWTFTLTRALFVLFWEECTAPAILPVGLLPVFGPLKVRRSGSISSIG